MQTSENVRKYELMVIFSGEMTEGDFEKEITEFRKMLREGTQGITYEDLWGRQTFAYRIKKQWRGYYIVFNFAAPAEGILELRSNVKLNPHVLRHLLITVPDDYVPGRYKTETLPEEDEKEEEGAKRRGRRTPCVVEEKIAEVKAVPAEETVVPEKEQKAKATVAGKEEEEQLKNVEKKLEKILENPDIDIR